MGVLHTISSMFGMFSVQGYLEVMCRFERRTKNFNILNRVIEGQSHFGMPRGAKLSLALNEAEWVALYSTSKTSSERVPPRVKLKRNY